MALMTCTECGKEISEKCKACLNCGEPNEVYRKNENKRQTKLLFIRLLLLAVTFIGIMFFINSGGFEWVGNALGNLMTNILFEAFGIS